MPSAVVDYDMIQHGLALPADADSFQERSAGILHSFHGGDPTQLAYATAQGTFFGRRLGLLGLAGPFHSPQPPIRAARRGEDGTGALQDHATTDSGDPTVLIAQGDKN